ncbi:hypothetical protein [Variovorax saccharolyticus]|uniref:hypothetical protein n=1 Tax=Variovorax saccharolyticus TaxID=3053516 RepID=UPI00257876C4|nr:hypothetical protein [Variovorax sp. J31P216]MDM0029788.1 hypothetical protein [Variovorax sp. J31P216]
MKLEAKLLAQEGQEWNVSALALYTELARFPRLFVKIDPQDTAFSGLGRFVLKLEYFFEEQGQGAPMALDDSSWYVRSWRSLPNSSQLWITFVADPGCDLQVRPFGCNRQGADTILMPHLDSTKTVWVDDLDAPGLAQIETLVSGGETFEQLARRVAALTNETFRVAPTAHATWSLNWATTVKALTPKSSQRIDEGIYLYAESQMLVEAHTQACFLPRDYSEALREVSEQARVFHVHRPVHYAEPLCEAVHFDVPRNEDNQVLPALCAHWYSLNEIGKVQDLWRWRDIAAGDANGDAFVVGSLFLYEADDAHQGLVNAASTFAALIGDRGAPPAVLNTQGWSAYVFAVPAQRMPREKALLDHLIERSGLHAVWEGLLLGMGCGQQDLRVPEARALGILPAIVINNPTDTQSGPIARSEDGLTYRTRIWVRLPGFDGALEIDWATPFASRDNSANGGGAGGDLILVPEENSFGFVNFVGGHGSPLFFGMTHYPDVTASLYIDPAAHKHALILDGGLQLKETQRDVLIQTWDELVLRANRATQRLGERRR